MKLKNLLFIFIVFISIYNYSQNRITPDDFNILLGDWTGTLTYIDYSSNKPYTMPANLKVKLGKNINQLSLFNIYPNEPKANNKDKLKISDNGAKLNNINVKSVERSSDGKVEIITEYSGKDNKKKALVRNVYILVENQFIIRKEVKFENSQDWLKRNEFNYIRLQ